MKNLSCIVFMNIAAILMGQTGYAQSVDWESQVYREPQVRYILLDVHFTNNINFYKEYSTDPDSKQAVKWWEDGVRIANASDFERQRIKTPYGDPMRLVYRGTKRTITGNEVLLTRDMAFQQSPMRVVLADLTLSNQISIYEQKKEDPNVKEALQRWTDGARVINGLLFETQGNGANRRIVYKGTNSLIDGYKVVLNTDLAYPEVNARYFMIDIFLGGSVDFYRKASVMAHEMGCLEADTRYENGVTITNLHEFERKQVNGQTVITKKGSATRISGMEVKLSSD